MTIQPFDLETFPLEGTRLIEASAGTGKTFNLVGLYLRMLLQKKLGVRNILVMTFTRAATQELRERIRIRLARAAEIALQPGTGATDSPEDALLEALVSAAATREPRADVGRRLRHAAARMDEASIFTIHAFAHHAASENAFASRLPFDRGEQVDDRRIYQTVLTDAWRSRVFGREPLEAGAFREFWPDPSALARDLTPVLEKPQLVIAGPDAQAIDASRARLDALWPTGGAEWVDLLLRAEEEDALLRKPGRLYEIVTRAGGMRALLAPIEARLAHPRLETLALPDWVADLASPERAGEHFKKAACKTWFQPWRLDVTGALADYQPLARIAAARELAGQLRARLDGHKAERRQYSFADMIEALYQAIHHTTSGDELADALFHQWPCALVDEFQDTDPRQYSILRRIYQQRPGTGETGALIMIGDPKQAIYGFRGGDLFTYLDAAADADGRYGLTTNYRSSAQLLTAVETLFRGPVDATPAGPFLIPEIRFQPIACGRTDAPRLTDANGSALPALTVWSIADTRLKRAAQQQRMLAAVIGQIQQLLDPRSGAWFMSGNTAQEVPVSRSPVRPGDIAVLVNTNREATDVQRALAGVGIAAVCLHQSSVFDTAEADELLRVLRAAVASASNDSIRAALATRLLGHRLGDLIRITTDETTWLDVRNEFQQASERWQRGGVLAMLGPILQRAAAGIVALQDGERRMTNYLHLAELLAAAEPGASGPGGLIRWLGRQIQESARNGFEDASQLRLESDAALVRIATIHKVKGLQYPIVLMPFSPWLGLSQMDADPPYQYHDHARRPCIHLGRDSDGAARVAAIREARAESLRLLYVALTRAESACYLAWGGLGRGGNAALAWLLHAQDGIETGKVDRSNTPSKALSPENVAARLDEWRERAAGNVAIVDPPVPADTRLRAADMTAILGEARNDLPAPRREWSMQSFSRWTAGATSHSPGRSRGADAVPGAEDEPGAAPVVVAESATQSAIPWRGPDFGNALHRLLETEAPGDWPAPPATGITRLDDERRQRVARALRAFGLVLPERDSDHPDPIDAVGDLVSRTLHTPLPHIGPLAGLADGLRCAELEFHFPLDGGAATELLAWLADHGFAPLTTGEPSTQQLFGMMQGFIDLTVEAGGRFWILDYKTNDLGAERRDYRPERLADTIHRHHYDLQYLIYLVALHRHLARTIPDYDPDQHLGGAQYLFLRGLNGRDAGTGVFSARPSTDLLLALDARLGGGPS